MKAPRGSGLILDAAKKQTAERLRALPSLSTQHSSNMHEQVYAQLRHAIMTGVFRPGETLTLRTIAHALGTSVIPARDAVLRLVAERALDRDNRRVHIPHLDRRRLEDVWQLRLMLEGEAASLAAARASFPEIAIAKKAAETVEEAHKAGRTDLFVAANQEFHFAVYRVAHSDLLLSLIEALWLQIGPVLGQAAELQPDLSTVCLTWHIQLVDALERRDSEAARVALQSDLEKATDIFGILTGAESGALLKTA